MISKRKEELQREASRLGVVILETFFKVMTHSKLRKHVSRVLFTDDHFFELGHLLECPSRLDDKAGGYFLPFLKDGQEDGFWALDLDPGDNKGHCVLGFDVPEILSENDEEFGKQLHLLDGWATNEDSDRANQDGVDLILLWDDEPGLEGTDFEQWLFKLYFDESLGLHHTEIDKTRQVATKITESQAAYIRCMFTL